MNLEEYLKTHHYNGTFRPYARYNVIGDQLEVFWSDEEAYSEEVNDGNFNVLAILKDFKINKIVGVNIYSIKKILENAGFELIRRKK